MFDRFKRLDFKARIYLIYAVGVVIYIAFSGGLNPNAEDLGTAAGALLSFAILLGPLFYVKEKNIKVKNPRPVFIEPPAWLTLLLVIPAIIASAISIVIIFLIIAFAVEVLVVINPAFDIINQVFKEGTFGFGMLMMTSIMLTFFWPVIMYSIYVMTHYERNIPISSPEWKRARAERKALRHTS